MITYTYFGSTALPQYDGSLPLSLGPVTSRVTPLRGGGAHNPFGAAGYAVRQGNRLRIRASFVEADETTLLTNVKAVQALIGTQAKLYRTQLADSSSWWTYAQLIDATADIVADNVLYAVMNLDFQILSPYWYSATESDTLLVDLSASDADLPTCGAESSSTSMSLPAINNPGNKPATVITLTFTTGDDALTAWALTNSTTGHNPSWAGTLNATKSLVLICGDMSIKNDGTDDYASLVVPTAYERWMEFAVGDNSLTLSLTGGGTGATLRIQFYPHYA